MLRTLPALLATSFLVTAAPGGAGDGGPVHYRLSDDAVYVEGCFGGCACPVWQAPLSGTFVLTPDSITGTYNQYDVTDVDWVIDLAADHEDIPITGGGTYTTFSEVVDLNEMSLDLAVDGEPETTFSTTFVLAEASFPDISISVSVGDLSCYDRLITVDAFPVTPDIDRDGQVGVNDLVAVVQAWDAP